MLVRAAQDEAVAQVHEGQEAASVVAPYEAVSSTEEIEAAKAKGIRFIQLQFTDIIGSVKAVTIPIHQLEGSVRHGTWFDGSSVEGFTRIAESDQYLMPDMRTFSEIPWSGGTAVGVIWDVYTPRRRALAGTFAGWVRTGRQFNVFSAPATGLRTACRFFST